MSSCPLSNVACAPTAIRNVVGSLPWGGGKGEQKMQIRFSIVRRSLDSCSVIAAHCIECGAIVNRHECGEIVDTDDFRCGPCDERDEIAFQAAEKASNDDLQREYQAACAQEEYNGMLQAARAGMKIRTAGLGYDAVIKFRQNSRFGFLRGEQFEAWGETVNNARMKALAGFAAFLKQRSEA